MTATVTQAFTNTATIGTSEYSLPNASTTLTARTDNGWFELFIDTSAIAAADVFTLKIKEKPTSGGTQRVIMSMTIPVGEMLVIPSLALLHGWDMTVQKVTGTDRSLTWSIRQP